jgi:histidinol-phosphate aminotransferase
VPGEQPKVKGLVKLNTNENPYPPAPAVIRAIKAASDDRLRLYPQPASQALREKLAKFHQCGPENIFVGNGSDEVLALAVKAFIEPHGEVKKSELFRATAQYFWPSYSLYPVLAAIHGAKTNPVPLEEDFSIPLDLMEGAKWNKKAALSLITTPNAPGGRAYRASQLEDICAAQNGVVLLDEAYVDFARENALSLALKHDNVLVARTFSKAYSLCFLRVGYCVGHPALIEALDKIRDSYNVNGLAQVAAIATLNNLGYYRKHFKRIIATRENLSRALRQLGFEVLPSETNFILVKPPIRPAEQWIELLRGENILVRWFKQPEVRQYLRITIGNDREAEALRRAIRRILSRLTS